MLKEIFEFFIKIKLTANRNQTFDLISEKKNKMDLSNFCLFCK
jgi:hypothetical protein